MISYEQLTEQHIKEHQLRQKKCDELDALESDAQRAWPSLMERFGGTWRQHTVNEAGPMGVIDAVAQDLEAFVELFEGAPKCDLPAKGLRRRNVHVS